MDLAAASDVAHELGLESATELTAAQAARIPSLLAKASFLFRHAAQRQFTPDTYTHRVRVDGDCARLPETPVESVTSVVDDDGNDVDYTRADGTLTLKGCPSSSMFVTATYVGGEIPSVVKGAVAEAAARALSVDPAVRTGAKRVDRTAGPFTERVEFVDGASATVALTNDDIALAESFRYPGTHVIVMQP